MEILAVESKQMYEQRSSMLEEQEELKKIIRLGSLQRWQEKRDASEKGRWTHRLITQVDNWVNRKHGESTITSLRCSQITDALGPTFTGLSMRRHHSARRGVRVSFSFCWFDQHGFGTGSAGFVGTAFLLHSLCF